MVVLLLSSRLRSLNALTSAPIAVTQATSWASIEIAALKQFYDALVVQDGCNLSGLGWDFEVPSFSPCNLKHNFGCDDSGRITKFALTSLSCSATIPSEIGKLSALSEMTRLQITEMLSGAIPTEIGSLVNLQDFDLSQNLLSGEIPAQLGKLTALTYLSLSRNSLSSIIPPEMGLLINLRELQLYQNLLTGSLPRNLSKLKSLEVLNIKKNQLTGVIPSEFGFLNSVYNLQLSENKLTGTLPKQLANMEHLRTLSLGVNQIAGQIPLELMDLTSLRVLSLMGNALTGSIPSILAPNFEYLRLEYNKLNGSLPDSLWSVSDLRYLDLSGNQLTGTLSSEVSLLKYLTTFILNSNNLSGELPSEMPQNLIACALHENKFSGSIPQTFKLLKKLRALWLYSNQLDGQLHQDLVEMTAMETFLVYNNAISGSIGDWIGKLSSLKVLDVHNNKLYGVFPSSGISGLLDLEYLSVSNNSFTGTIKLDRLPSLGFLDTSDNQLSGTISASFFEIKNLKFLDFSGNDFVGTLPVPASSTQMDHRLEYLRLGSNSLYGPIPSEYGALTALIELSLRDNALTGTLPPILANLKNLKRLHLSSNSFEDSLPEFIGKMDTLEELFLDANGFAGAISNSYCDLKAMRSLNLSSNAIDTTIPSCIHRMGVLETLWFSNISLHGSIPRELYNMTSLQRLVLSSSSADETKGLEGPLSSDIGLLKNLTFLSLNDNYLKGTVPGTLAQLSKLEHLDIGQNYFEFSIGGGGLDVFTADSTPQLSYVDISLNSFEGLIPGSLFLLPKIETVVMVGNCFRGTIPETICNATSAKNLILSGLSAGDSEFESCGTIGRWGKIWQTAFGFNARFVQKMVGTIPPCVFSLPNLVKLHMAGNGNEGRLPASLESWPANLKELVLSHNRLTQPIPVLLLRQFSRLEKVDLAYNRFNGTLDGTQLPAMSMDLTVNRFSGLLPQSVMQKPMGASGEFSLLQGNAFDCRGKAELPAYDPAITYTKCGSEIPNDAIYIFLSFFVAFVIFVWRNPRDKIQEKLLGVDEATISKEFPNIGSFLDQSRNILWVILALLAFFIMILLPVYATATSLYSSRTYSYIWVVSAAYKTGTDAAVLLTAFFVTFAVITFGLLVHFTSLKDDKKQSLLKPTCSSSPKSSETVDGPNAVPVAQREPFSWAAFAVLIARLVLVFSATILLALTVNISYVLAIPTLTSTQLIFTQISMAIFKAVTSFAASAFLGSTWSYLGFTELIHKFTDEFKDTDEPADTGKKEKDGKKAGNLFLEEFKSSYLIFVFLELFIRIIVPCGAAAYADRKCFNPYFHSSAAIPSHFSDELTVRAHDYKPGISVDLATQTVTSGVIDYLGKEKLFIHASDYYEPPFLYSYQCSSRILDMYAPVIATSLVIGLLKYFWGRAVRTFLDTHFSGSFQWDDMDHRSGRFYLLLLATTPRLDWTRDECDLWHRHVTAVLTKQDKEDERDDNRKGGANCVRRTLRPLLRQLPLIDLYGTGLHSPREELTVPVTDEEKKKNEDAFKMKHKDRLREERRNFFYQRHQTTLAYDLSMLLTFGIVCVPFGVMMLLVMYIKNYTNMERVKLFVADAIALRNSRQRKSLKGLHNVTNDDIRGLTAELKELEHECTILKDHEGTEIFRARWLLLSASALFTSYFVFDAAGDSLGGKQAQIFPAIVISLALGLSCVTEAYLRTLAHSSRPDTVVTVPEELDAHHFYPGSAGIELTTGNPVHRASLTNQGEGAPFPRLSIGSASTERRVSFSEGLPESARRSSLGVTLAPLQARRPSLPQEV